MLVEVLVYGVNGHGYGAALMADRYSGLLFFPSVLRYGSAEDAGTGVGGLAEFQRTLVIGDLASEYENELRVWLEELD